MTERIERPKTHRNAVAMKTYRDRVHALYADVRSWLDGDVRFRFERSSSVVADGLGEYEVDRLAIFIGEDRIADFRPIAATVILGAGRLDVIGLVDYAWLYYHERIIPGIVRPGWYWSDLRHDDGERFLNDRVFADILEEISDLERQPHPALPGRPRFVPQNP